MPPFHIPLVEIEEIRAGVDARGKIEPTFHVAVLDDDGEVVAEVEKLLYVRARDREPKTAL
jgi:hypothetical protein